MQKIISFSIWGNNPKYCAGAIINAQLAQKYFPDWKCKFFYDNTVPKIYIRSLNEFTNVETICVTDGSFGAFWRFLAMQENTIVLSRDCDSRLSLREKMIVDDWLNSKETLCVIRDHINHYEFPILAVMWGIKNGLCINLQKKMKNYWGTHRYLVDQYYLRDEVWPELKHNTKEYGIKETAWMRESYKDIGKNFIGQTYDENDTPVYEGKLND
jgi:hypothetical protein